MNPALKYIGDCLCRFLLATPVDRVADLLATGICDADEEQKSRWIALKSHGEKGEGGGARRVLLGKGGKILGTEKSPEENN